MVPQRGTTIDEGNLISAKTQTMKVLMVSGLSHARTREALAAIDLYNQAAKHFGFSICKSHTEARLKKLQRRLADIGGLEQFKIALRSIETSSRFTDFLLGRARGRDGKGPFKLDIDRLLSTNSGFDDVLAKLLDMATDGEDQKVGPNGRHWGWWHAQEQTLRNSSPTYWRELLAQHRPNGEWPWWYLGPPPGHPECLMHPDVIAENGFAEKFNSDGVKRA
jgi:hypothetical protein